MSNGSGDGLVVLGSGAVPLATAADRRAFVAAAGADDRRALANNRYSADVVAISRIATLPVIPDLPGDNALPRWLEEVAGYRVDDLRRRWRLGFDIDGPLDVVLLGPRDEAPVDVERVTARLAAIRAVAADPSSELLVAGRTSATTLAWLERYTAGRVRAWVEERGLRAASRLAIGSATATDRAGAVRGPISLLGIVLDEAGPAALGDLLARLCDAAIVDTRVLLAHRLGADEATWPSAEDRFASRPPAVRAGRRSVAPGADRISGVASIPIMLGGHTLVGPGMRLVIGKRGVRGPLWT